MRLGDERLDARVRKFVTALERNPAAGFPSAVNTVAEREAVYRLLGNERVTLNALLAPHTQQTVGRARALGERPLVVLDKTSFVFPGESDRDGLTRLGMNRQGFDAFFALAVSRERMPLGVLSIGDLDAESGRSGADDWLRAVTTAEQHIGELNPVYVMDREADAYALFVQLIDGKRDFVVRVSHERWVKEDEDSAAEMMRSLVGRTTATLEREVKLTRRSGAGKAQGARRRHPPRDGRNATLTVRTCPVILPRPRKLPKTLPPLLRVNLVQVVEVNPPAEAPPVEWLLFTTLPVDDEVAVGAVVDTYRARWTIEEYFKALKSGCSYEKRQLESRAALLNALGILAPLAWRLLALRSVASDQTAPASNVLESDEIHVLRIISQDIKLGPEPTAAEALYALARLGGHFPQNGRPGWKVLWAGFQKLIDRVEGYRIAQAERAGASKPKPNTTSGRPRGKKM
jgi:hypothetical protein